MPDTPFELVCDTRCQVGESCVWDAARGWVWFCDIPAGTVFGYDTRTAKLRSFSLPAPVGSFGLCRSGELVVALRDRFVIFDPERNVSRPFAQIPNVPPDLRLNDGKVGPDGAFWVGEIDEAKTGQPVCSLYRLDPDGTVETKVTGILCSNGLAWTPDTRTMFHSDTRAYWLDAYDFDAATGAISNRRRITTPDEAQGRPDGAACDAGGNYWSAGVSAACINVFSPTGNLLRKIAFPVKTPTMPCFAGDGYLYVTSLSKGMSDEDRAKNPGAGGLFRMKTDVQGTEVGLFDPR